MRGLEAKPLSVASWTSAAHGGAVLCALFVYCEAQLSHHLLSFPLSFHYSSCFCVHHHTATCFSPCQRTGRHPCTAAAAAVWVCVRSASFSRHEREPLCTSYRNSVPLLQARCVPSDNNRKAAIHRYNFPFFLLFLDSAPQSLFARYPFYFSSFFLIITHTLPLSHIFLPELLFQLFLRFCAEADDPSLNKASPHACRRRATTTTREKAKRAEEGKILLDNTQERCAHSSVLALAHLPGRRLRIFCAVSRTMGGRQCRAAPSWHDGPARLPSTPSARRPRWES